MFTLSNMNISAASEPITIKFYRKHHLGRGKAALGFGPDRISTLVSMATDSSHRVLMGENLVIGSSSFLQVTRTIINSRHTLNFGQIRQSTVELTALEHLKKSP